MKKPWILLTFAFGALAALGWLGLILFLNAVEFGIRHDLYRVRRDKTGELSQWLAEKRGTRKLAALLWRDDMLVPLSESEKIAVVECLGFSARADTDRTLALKALEWGLYSQQMCAYTRVSCASSLAFLDDDRAWRILEEALLDLDSAGPRALIISFIRDSKRKEAVPYLIAALKTPSEHGAHMYSVLKMLTGEDMPEDFNEWNRWYVESAEGNNAKKNPNPDAILAEIGVRRENRVYQLNMARDEIVSKK